MNHLITHTNNQSSSPKTRWSQLMLALSFLVASIIQLLLMVPVKGIEVKSDVSYSIAGTVKNCGVMQGGATDQQFLYFACVKNGQIRIVKYTPDGVEVARSGTFSRGELGHINDMTYNSKLRLLVVSVWDLGGGANEDKVKLMDPNTFEIKGSMKTSDGRGSTSNLCYNAATDQYLVGGRIYDADFKFIKRIYSPSQVDSALGIRDSDEVYNQGIECNASRIYIMRAFKVSGNNDYNLIAIYDWSGTFIGSHKVPVNDEGENFAIIGNTMYMGINEGSWSSGGNADNDYFIRIDGLVTGANACSAPQNSVSLTTPAATEEPEFDTSTNAYRSYNNIPFTGGSLSCCLASSSDLVGATNPERAFNFLVSTPIKTNNGKPLTQSQAAGVVGNFMVESTPEIKPDIENSIGAYGIAQWLGGRRTELEKFATSKGTEASDLRTQLEFVVHEIENKESAVIKDAAFRGASQDEAGARVAAVRWDTRYERSGGAGLTARQDNAAKIWGDFGDQGINPTEDDVSAPDQATTLSSVTSGCGGSSGEYVFPLQGTKEQIRSWGNDPGTTEWKSGRYHENVFPGYYGVDILGPEATPIVAFHSGTVLSIRNGDSYGALSIQIIDEEGYTYYYQHLSLSRGAKVKEKDKVEAGTLIGYIGNKREGWNTISHLHIDKSKNPGAGYRGTCTASKGNCPIASEDRFVKIVKELHDTYEKLSDSAASSL